MGKTLLAIIVLVLTIYAFYDVVATPKRAARRMPRWAWGVLVFVPVVGPVLWLLLGKPRRNTPPRQRPVRPVTAPDDDPDFLRDLNRRPEDALEEWEKEYRRKRRAHGEDT